MEGRTCFLVSPDVHGSALTLSRQRWPMNQLAGVLCYYHIGCFYKLTGGDLLKEGKKMKDLQYE